MSQTEVTKYTEASLSNIRESDFLSPQDFEAVKIMTTELQDAFEKTRIWRTDTEMRVSVLNDIQHPTKASKYWQATLEQSVFFEQLVELSFAYRRNLVQIERLQKNIEKETDVLRRKELEIDLEEALYRKLHQEKQSKDRVRELKLWSQIKTELDDGTFNTHDINIDQLTGLTRTFVSETMMLTDHTDLDTKRNIMAKMVSAVRRCRELGIYDDVMSVFPDTVRKMVDDAVDFIK